MNPVSLSPPYISDLCVGTPLGLKIFDYVCGPWLGASLTKVDRIFSIDREYSILSSSQMNHFSDWLGRISGVELGTVRDNILPVPPLSVPSSPAYSNTTSCSSKLIQEGFYKIPHRQHRVQEVVLENAAHRVHGPLRRMR